MFCYGGVSSTYITNVIFTTVSGKIQSYTIPVEPDSWRKIEVDLSIFEERSSIASIQIGFCGSDTAYIGPVGWAGLFFLDNIVAYETDNKSVINAPFNGTIDKNGKINFNIALSDINDISTKFVIVITKKNGEKQLVDVAKYVTNPSTLAKNTESYPIAKSIKGLQVQLNSDAERLGVQHAAINIGLNSLLTITNHGSASIPYTLNGKTYYFIKKNIESLDNVFSNLTSNNVITNAILIMYPSDITRPDSPNRYIAHPDANNKGEAVIDAINLTDQRGVDYYTAMISFIAQRYNGDNKQYGRIDGYIVGNEIGAAKMWHDMGNKTIEEFVKQYETQLRLTNTIVKQWRSSARVYVSLDHFWASGFTYSNKQIINLLNQYSKAGGDYDWNIAFHPYPELLSNARTWSDRTATDSFDTEKITFKNLQVLPRYLKQSEFLYNGQSRRIILSEQGFNTFDDADYSQSIQAAAYAYAYYKAVSIPEIDSFILHRHVDHTGEGGYNLGLWTTVEGQTVQPDKQKRIYNVFKDIDTVNSLNISDFALNVIGSDIGRTISDWKEIIPEFDRDKIKELCNRPVMQTAISGNPFDVIGETTLSNGTTNNWVANDNTSSLKLEKDATLNKNVLTAKVNGSNFKEFKGMTYTSVTSLDLKNSPIIMVNVKATNIGAGKKAEFMVRAYSGDKVIEGSYIGAAEEWNHLAIDISSFEGRSTVDRIKVWVRPVEDVIWNSGTISIENLAIASSATVKNISVTTDVEEVTKVGDVVQVSIKNNGNRLLNEEAKIICLNGISTDIFSKEINLNVGQEITFPITITGFNIPFGKSGKISVEIAGKAFEFSLTEIPYPDYVQDGTDYIIGDFENAWSDGWTAGDYTLSAEPVTGYANVPQTASHGQYCMQGIKSSVTATTPSYLTRNYKNPLDLSSFNKISFDFFGWSGTSVDYAVELLLIASDGTGQSYSRWYAADNQWHSYNIDISDFAGRKSIKSISIAYYGFDNLIYAGYWNGFFFIDNVRALYGGTGSNNNSVDTVTGSAYTTLTDKKTTVSVTGLSIWDNLELRVESITDNTNELYNQAETQLMGLEEVTITNLYDIQLIDNGGILEPNATISLPLPDLYDKKNLYVIAHYWNDGSLTFIVPQVKNGRFVFETDSLGQFAVLFAGTKA